MNINESSNTYNNNNNNYIATERQYFSKHTFLCFKLFSYHIFFLQSTVFVLFAQFLCFVLIRIFCRCIIYCLYGQIIQFGRKVKNLIAPTYYKPIRSGLFACSFDIHFSVIFSEFLFFPTFFLLGFVAIHSSSLKHHNIKNIH